jgi:hypothetical protein
MGHKGFPLEDPKRKTGPASQGPASTELLAGRGSTERGRGADEAGHVSKTLPAGSRSRQRRTHSGEAEPGRRRRKSDSGSRMTVESESESESPSSRRTSSAQVPRRLSAGSTPTLLQKNIQSGGTSTESSEESSDR